MMLGYLLGRSGIKTVVLEKHADFFRDFRGDTVHPSTLQVMQELGLLEDFLKIPHQQLTHMQGMFGKTPIRIADLSRLETTCPFIALMPQWDFLNFLETKGARFPSLQILKNTEAIELVRDGSLITGVVAKVPDGTLQISADLTVACDGGIRSSASRPVSRWRTSAHRSMCSGFASESRRPTATESLRGCSAVR